MFDGTDISFLNSNCDGLLVRLLGLFFELFIGLFVGLFFGLLIGKLVFRKRFAHTRPPMGPREAV